MQISIYPHYDRSLLSLPAFCDIIAKPGTDHEYLGWYFKQQLLGVCAFKVFEDKRFTRRQLVQRLNQAHSQIEVLSDLLDDEMLHPFINGRFECPLNRPACKQVLSDLDHRIQAAVSDTEIVDDAGKVRRGAGTVHPPEGCSVKQWIALMVVGALEFQNEKVDCKKACQAAECLMVAIGGRASYDADRARASWAHYIKMARDSKWEWYRTRTRESLAFYQSVLEVRKSLLQ